MDAETPTPTKTSGMTLIYKTDQYSRKITVFTLVDNAEVAASLTALIALSGDKAEAIEVPIWPNVRKEN